jgi:MarR family transcriptional regulator, organic hydroperoxide resistance regulator
MQTDARLGLAPGRSSKEGTTTMAAKGKSKDGLGPVLEFMRLLWSVDHRLQSTSKRMEARLGVTGPQRLVVRIVGRFPNISAGEIADVLQIHPSTLTGILRRLEARGALARTADPDDGRRALLKLTRVGEEIDATKDGTVEAAVTRALATTTDDQLGATRAVLGAIAAELEKDLS